MARGGLPAGDRSGTLSIMIASRVSLATALGVLLLLGSCDQLYRACTAIGCSDSFNVTVTPAAGTFPAGEHEVVIAIDGSAPRTCTFRFPFTGSIESARCTGEGGLNLTVWPLQTCQTITQGGAVGQSCTPIPGKFEERLTVPGLPARLRITQRLAQGEVYLDRDVTPRYEEFYPNGKDCGGACKQAGATWEF
jgi:hypothetical protein